MKTEVILSALEAKHPGEKEYLQAVKEVLLSIEEVYNRDRPVQGRHPLPSFCQPVHPEVLRIRTDFQKRFDNIADGRW